MSHLMNWTSGYMSDTQDHTGVPTSYHLNYGYVPNTFSLIGILFGYTLFW